MSQVPSDYIMFVAAATPPLSSMHQGGDKGRAASNTEYSTMEGLDDFESRSPRGLHEFRFEPHCSRVGLRRVMGTAQHQRTMRFEFKAVRWSWTVRQIWLPSSAACFFAAIESEGF
jgi:hypothetical protein